MVRNFIQQVMIPKAEAGQFEQVIDYKTRLQETLQTMGDVLITYEVMRVRTGPCQGRSASVCQWEKSSVKDVAGLKRLHIQQKKQENKVDPRVFKGN